MAPDACLRGVLRRRRGERSRSRRAREVPRGRSEHSLFHGLRRRWRAPGELFSPRPRAEPRPRGSEPSRWSSRHPRYPRSAAASDGSTRPGEASAGSCREGRARGPDRGTAARSPGVGDFGLRRRRSWVYRAPCGGLPRGERDLGALYRASDGVHRGERARLDRAGYALPGGHCD